MGRLATATFLPRLRYDGRWRSLAVNVAAACLCSTGAFRGLPVDAMHLRAVMYAIRTSLHRAICRVNLHTRSSTVRLFA